MMSGTSLDGIDFALCEFVVNHFHKGEVGLAKGSEEMGEREVRGVNGCSGSQDVDEKSGSSLPSTYRILKAATVPYSEAWTARLTHAYTLSALEFVRLDVELGTFIGQEARRLLSSWSLSADYIASHGHTIFHQPASKITKQIGSGPHIAAAARVSTICDFRSLDVALGGQGAPLVPLGDALLFSSYDVCMNLGGIANLSYDKDAAPNAEYYYSAASSSSSSDTSSSSSANFSSSSSDTTSSTSFTMSPPPSVAHDSRTSSRRVRCAYDICPVNMGFNFLASKLGKAYDKNGEIGRKGMVIESLLSSLNTLRYYSIRGPKSLGIEWFNSNVMPLLEECLSSSAITTEGINDLMCTLVEHAAVQVSLTLQNAVKDILGHGNSETNFNAKNIGRGRVEDGVASARSSREQEDTFDAADANVKQKKRIRVLLTGGGAYNSFLVERMRAHSDSIASLEVPSSEIVEFKEAIIFAFLGYRRVLESVNCLSSCTNASSDSAGGAIYLSPCFETNSKH